MVRSFYAYGWSNKDGGSRIVQIIGGRRRFLIDGGLMVEGAVIV
ncbi:hypothetical protein A2U01_0083103, partial [Trifolium medium]|nr:hypothetical protein [Trifolium medium]